MGPVYVDVDRLESLYLLLMKAYLSLLLVALYASTAAAQDRFEQAQALARRTENLVLRDRVKPVWLPGDKALWYRVKTAPKTEEFVLVDATTGERQTAADLAALKLPQPQPEVLQTSKLPLAPRRSTRNGASSGIKFTNRTENAVGLFWINPQGERVAYGSLAVGEEREQHTYAGHAWLIASAAGEPLAFVEAEDKVLTIEIDGKGLPPRAEAPRERRRGPDSPDGKWTVIIDDGLIKLRDRQTNETKHLATQLDGKFPFRGGIAWAPNSEAFVVSSAAEVEERCVTVVDSSPKNQLQPQLKEFKYTKPGDPLPKPVPVLFRLTDDGHQCHVVKSELFPSPFTESYQLDVKWADDSSEFYFDYNQRGHQLYRLLAVDVTTAEVRVVVEETSQTFIDYHKLEWRHWLPQTGELLWMSERDGWCHVWRYDVKTGAVKNQVTQGAWPVRQVVHIDDEKQQLWFMASGLRKEEDPYHLHLCRVNFDGTGFQQLTQGDGQHRIEFSPSHEFFVDTWSRVDHPPVSELRRSDNGKLVCVLEKADAEPLVSAGWTLPERFVAKGRDGVTDIHGILLKPSHFDPAKKYPVLEEIYAGPHSAHVPKEFARLQRQHLMAELGFIVVQIDGMGTNHRGKAFHDVCWKNLKDAGFPDRIAWMKAAAETRPWMDLTRVGIYGGSAGGQNAMRALLDHHDFYRVAVADCGCHDNRMDKIWWNEQWMGWPVDDSYAASSNAVDAHKLQGNLLLIVGELDTNVDPASTTQVVAALQKAGKTFDYMPIIGAGHGAAETPYGSRLRREFLIGHLQP